MIAVLMQLMQRSRSLFLLALGVVTGGGAGLAGLGIVRLVSEGPIPWIVAGAMGIPIVLLVLVVPLLFLSGLREVFRSSTWMLTYRELHALESLEPGELTVLDAADLS